MQTVCAKGKYKICLREKKLFLSVETSLVSDMHLAAILLLLLLPLIIIIITITMYLTSLSIRCVMSFAAVLPRKFFIILYVIVQIFCFVFLMCMSVDASVI